MRTEQPSSRYRGDGLFLRHAGSVLGQCRLGDPPGRWPFFLLVLSLIFGSPVHALVDDHLELDDQVSIEITFNQPGLAENQPSSRLEDRFIELISQALPGSEISMSIYTFKRETVARALLEAQQRGVQVRVVVDNKSRGSPALDLLTSGDGTLQPLGDCDGRCLKVCWLGCQGLHINHNKFALFSELEDGGRWVVVQTSANLTRGQLRHYNDLIVIKNDRRIYRAFEGYFADLMRPIWRPSYARHGAGSAPIEAYFFPRLLGADPVLDILGDVECDDESMIRVAHSRFEAQRSKVAKRLRTLAEGGCDVHVLARSEPGKRSPGTSVVDELADLITVLPYKGPALEKRQNALHTKLILIKARYRGSEEPHHIVLTGSHNLSITSLRLNDEVLLRIDDEAVFDSYAGFWESIIEAHQDRLTDDG